MDEWLKESLKKDIKYFVDTRFIPKFAPRSENNEYEIEDDCNVWRIFLEKEDIVIVFCFYNVYGGEKILKINSDIYFSNDISSETYLYDNLNEVFNEIIKLTLENKIKNIS